VVFYFPCGDFPFLSTFFQNTSNFYLMLSLQLFILFSYPPFSLDPQEANPSLFPFFPLRCSDSSRGHPMYEPDALLIFPFKIIPFVPSNPLLLLFLYLLPLRVPPPFLPLISLFLRDKAKSLSLFGLCFLSRYSKCDKAFSDVPRTNDLHAVLRGETFSATHLPVPCHP